jgi:hypothetical protein
MEHTDEPWNGFTAETTEPLTPADSLDPSWANWRVLLPDSGGRSLSRLVLLGGPEDLARLTTRLGVAEKVSRAVSGPGEFDAAVVIGGAEVSLPELAACLKPRGWLYWEIPRPKTICPGLAGRRLRRALRAAGLTPTGLYWVRSGSNGPVAFVPLDARGALGWYLDTFATPVLGAIAARLPAPSRLLALLAAGRVAVTAVASSQLERPALLTSAELPDRLRSMTLRPVVHFREHSRRAVVFPFTPVGAIPEAVLKFSPVPERGFRTRQEQGTLSEIRKASPSAIRAAIPEPLGFFSWTGLTVGVESYVRGRSIQRAAALPAKFSTRLADLDRVVGWLCAFQAANSFGVGTWGGELWPLEKWIEEPLRTLEAKYTLPPDVERLFTKVRVAARSLIGTPLPMVLCNWSFSVGNVCRLEGGVSVYDWETVASGLPFTDLEYFLVDWGRLMKPRYDRDWRVLFRDLLVDRPTDRVSRAVRRSIDRYFATLGIDARFGPLLGALTWIQRAEKRVLKDQRVHRSLDPRLVALAATGSHRLDP